MFNYKPDVVAKSKIPGHGFVHTPFTLKFVPPALFATTQILLVPMIYLKGTWTPTVWVWFIASFLVPATTAISGRWLNISKKIHAPLAYAVLFGLGYNGGIGGTIEFLILVGMNIWYVIYWSIMGAGLADPLKRSLEVLARVKTGDLTPRVKLNFPRKDELGRVADGINGVLDSQSAMVKTILEAAKKVQLHANDVAKRANANKERAENQEKRMLAMQKTMSEVGQTAGEVANASNAQKEAAEKSGQRLDGLMQGMESVTDSSITQIEEANEAAGRVQAMGEAGAMVVATAGKQGESVARVANAMAKMSSAVEEMAKVTAQSTEYGRQVLTAADEGAQSINAAVEGMRAIAESSDQITAIIAVITDIAKRTNLLSHNAAIEAARAGERGKGFAVVANEVGKLALRSSEAAKEITFLIKDSTNRVAEGTTLTDRSQMALKKIAEGGQINMKSIEAISDATTLLADNTRAVTTMMEELNAMAGEIAETAGKQGERREAAQNALSALVEKSNAISEQVNQATQTATHVNTEMSGIVERTGEMQDMTDTQAGRSQKLVEITSVSAEAAKQTVQGATHVVGITDELKQLSESLTRQVEQFTV